MKNTAEDTEKLQQAIEKIDEIFEYKTSLVRSHKEVNKTELTKLLSDFLIFDKITLEDTCVQLQEIFDEQDINKQEMRRKIKATVEDMKILAESFESGKDRQYELKITQLMKALFNWIEFSKEAITKAW